MLQAIKRAYDGTPSPSISGGINLLSFSSAQQVRGQPNFVAPSANTNDVGRRQKKVKILRRVAKGKHVAYKV